jgi:hypothetical protein
LFYEDAPTTHELCFKPPSCTAASLRAGAHLCRDPTTITRASPATRTHPPSHPQSRRRRCSASKKGLGQRERSHLPCVGVTIQSLRRFLLRGKRILIRKSRIVGIPSTFATLYSFALLQVTLSDGTFSGILESLGEHGKSCKPKICRWRMTAMIVVPRSLSRSRSSLLSARIEELPLFSLFDCSKCI